jgi:hypothetical protein
VTLPLLVSWLGVLVCVFTGGLLSLVGLGHGENSVCIGMFCVISTGIAVNVVTGTVVVTGKSSCQPSALKLWR